MQKTKRSKTYASNIDGKIDLRWKTQKEKDEFQKDQELYSLEQPKKKLIRLNNYN